MEPATKIVLIFMLGFAFGIIMSLKNKPDLDELDSKVKFLSMKYEELRRKQIELQHDIKTLSKKLSDTGEQPERNDQEDT